MVKCIEIEKANREKTALTSYHGLSRYMRVPFGLEHAPGILQSAMHFILLMVKWLYAVVYLDEIFILSCSTSEHIAQLRQVLNLLRNSEVTLKLMRCSFFTNTMSYLGHVTRPRWLKIVFYNTDGIKGLKTRTNITEVRSFHGLCNVF